MRREEKALNIAKYVVEVAYQQCKPISNLKLQGVLYFLWNEYYKETGKYLFYENFYAWSIGPVVPEVYYFYCPWAGTPIMAMDKAEYYPAFGWIGKKLDEYLTRPLQYFLQYGQKENPAAFAVGFLFCLYFILPKNRQTSETKNFCRRGAFQSRAFSKNLRLFHSCR